MILSKYKDGTTEINEKDKLESKVNTLVNQEVETIFIAKNKSDIVTFKGVVAPNFN